MSDSFRAEAKAAHESIARAREAMMAKPLLYIDGQAYQNQVQAVAEMRRHLGPVADFILRKEIVEAINGFAVLNPYRSAGGEVQVVFLSPLPADFVAMRVDAWVGDLRAQARRLTEAIEDFQDWVREGRPE